MSHGMFLVEIYEYFNARLIPSRMNLKDAIRALDVKNDDYLTRVNKTYMLYSSKKGGRGR